MSTGWGRKPSGGKASANSRTIPYVLTTDPGTSETIARSLAIGYSPVIDGGLYRQSVEVLDLGNGAVWDVDVTYGPKQKKEPEVGDFKWNFSVGGGTKHITQAKSHVASYVPSGETAVDHKGAIGVTEDGNIEGTDVPDFLHKWSETWQLLLANFGFTYSTVLSQLAGHTNNAPFRGFGAGTVLFENAEGGQSLKEPQLLEVTFHFQRSPAATGLSVGDITDIAKGGWDYLWTEYATKDGGTAKRLARQPKQVNVDRVIDQVDLSLLGIGTASL